MLFVGVVWRRSRAVSKEKLGPGIGKEKDGKSEKTDANNPVSCSEGANHMVNGAYLSQHKKIDRRKLSY